MNSQAENWVCDGSAEKILRNRPHEEEIAVDESLMAQTSNVKGLSKQKLTHFIVGYNMLRMTIESTGKVSWHNSFSLHTSSIFAFIFTQFKSLYLVKAFIHFSKLQCQNKWICIRCLQLH